MITSQSTAQKLDKVIAQYFYACNIPFNVADSQHFKNMIAELRPGYKPPTRKCLAGKLLDTVYEDVTQQ